MNKKAVSEDKFLDQSILDMSMWSSERNVEEQIEGPQPKIDSKEVDEHKNTTKSQGNEPMIKCKHCDKKFSRQGLGGHMSRVHPGKSSDYKLK